MALDADTARNSLGFAKAPCDTRVVVAMSGGVDSSVVAAHLAAEGYDVVGVTLQLYDHGAALAKKGACCAGVDIHDARRVAEDLGFPHYVLDYENIFRDAVIDEFADSYLAGATPVPCIRCNERVKFKDLLETARDLDADCMATGHYIQRIEGPDGPELHSAADPVRDQSYFLFSTTPEQLDYLRFPLGHLPSKQATRELAAKYGLQVADKPDSQDICFVPDGDYAGVIEKLRQETKLKAEEMERQTKLAIEAMERELEREKMEHETAINDADNYTALEIAAMREGGVPDTEVTAPTQDRDQNPGQNPSG